MRRVDEIVLDLQVFKKKRRRLRVVGVNAANFGRRKKNKLRLCFREKLLDGGGVQQVEFPPSPSNQIFEPLPLKFAPDGAAHQSVMSCHINARAFVHQHGWMLRKNCRRVNSKLTPAPQRIWTLNFGLRTHKVSPC